MSEQHKKLSIDALIGQTIKKAEFDKDSCVLFMKDGSSYGIDLQDDSCGCNDSYAYFGEIQLSDIIGKKIVSAIESNSDSYGAVFVIKTKNAEGTIQVIHEHNGYYGWGYELHKSNP